MFLSSSERPDDKHEGDNESGDHGSGDNQTDRTLANRPFWSVYLMIAVFAVHICLSKGRTLSMRTWR
jgi:hypothetical protein